MGHTINMRSGLLAFFVCASLASHLFGPEVEAAGRQLYRQPSRRSELFANYPKTNELLSNILSDVDTILNNWEIHEQQPQDNNKPTWLRDVLENARQRRSQNFDFNDD